MVEREEGERQTGAGGKDGEEEEEGNEEEEEEEEEIFFSVAILNVKSEIIPKRDKQGNTCNILSMHPSRNYHKRLTQEYFKSAENILNTKIFYVKMAIIEK